MKLVSFEFKGRTRYGHVVDEEVVPLDEGPSAAADLKHWLESRNGDWAGTAGGGTRIELDEVTLLPPIPNASKIFCIATNFHEPAREGKQLPGYPLLFTRFADTLVGHGEPIVKPSVSERLDFEGEVAVVIGKPGCRIAKEEAMAHVAGYSCFNDGSVRDWQKHSTQFTAGKNFAGSGSFGPWIVTADEIADPNLLRLETRVNNQIKQSISLDKFIFDVPWLIAYISTFAPLSSGDVIVTGTPSGFGSSREPMEFLRPGDVVEVDVSHIGVLRNTVVADMRCFS